MPRVSVRRKLWEKAREYADDEEMTVSEVVEDALADFFEDDEEDEE